ncbi:hypothetical protein [Desulfoluna sp.]|uniref:hypothetical protein n=1 Tax=Desulfoluna sp. TaxID=2045199 RepID=UPI0026189066|nr:hypothetical protein [Desulfoluna sp.]
MNGNPMDQSQYLRKRTHSIGVSMIVMGGSFFLYYLGLFGNVQGPLTPSTLGASLAGLGLTKKHMLLFFLSFFIMSLIWNHLFNLTAFVTGARRRCLGEDEEGHVCGAVTRKIKGISAIGEKVVQYECAQGHLCTEAHFEAVKKGVVSYTVTVAALMFCVIVMYCS